MDRQIMDNFQMMLLQNPKRLMNEKLEIIEVYDQPERLNEMDHIVGVNEMVCESLNSENK